MVNQDRSHFNKEVAVNLDRMNDQSIGRSTLELKSRGERPKIVADDTSAADHTSAHRIILVAFSLKSRV